MKTLITGASGFLGTATAQAAYEEGFQVTGLDVAPLPGNFFHHTIQCDLTSRKVLSELLKGREFDSVIHLAGVRGTPDEMYTINVQGTLNLLENLEHLPHQITLAGSCAVYGVPDDISGLVTEEDSLKPVTDYGKSMLEKETIAGKFCRERGVSFSSARIFNLFGPGQSTAMMTSAIAERLVQIRTGRLSPPLKTGPLHTKRDLIHVKDAADALIRITSSGINRPLNVGTGRAIQGREIVDLMQEILGMDIPVDEAAAHGAMVECIKADMTDTFALLEWKPVIPLRTSLKQIVDEFLRQDGQ